MDRYYNPVRTYQGYHCIKELAHVIPEIDMKEKNILMLMWNDELRSNEDIQYVINQCSDYNWHFYHFAASNPEVYELFEVYQKTKDMKIELVIAVGGGSVLDVGKSLCCMYESKIKNAGELCMKIRNKECKKSGCNWIGVPTTAGTGSEVTCWATVWNSTDNSKLSLESQQNYAYAAFIDSQFASSMPVQLAVSSALDAVAHATESYWAKATNMVSEIYACKAISVIMNHIQDLMNPERSEEAHDFMSKGSMLAGMAFSNTKTTACHSLSYPLTMHYHIPHGVAVSMLLTAVMRKNELYIKDKEKLYQAFQISDVDELDCKMKEIFEQAQIRYKLKDWNVKKEDIPKLAKQGATKGRIDNNPRELTEEDIVEILESIYE